MRALRLARTALAAVTLASSLIVTVPALPVIPARAAEGEIVIHTGALDPPALKTTVDRRVTFVNRSGRLVHLEFLDDSARHQVFQVPGQIWAVFHRPGLHPYVVHFPTLRIPELRGVVEAEDDPDQPLHTCAGPLTVMGECLEP